MSRESVDKPINAVFRILNPYQREVVKRRAVDMIEATTTHDQLIFLDRSARPLSQFVYELYPALHPDLNIPRVDYVNIGMEKVATFRSYVSKHIDEIPMKPSTETWRGEEYVPIGEDISIPLDYWLRSHLSDFLPYINDTERLVKIFGTQPIEQLVEFLQETLSRKSLIVDELRVTGMGIDLAKQILKTADPQCDFSKFVLIESYEDQEVFGAWKIKTSGSTEPNVPWRSSDTNFFESRSKRRSFVLEPDFKIKGSVQLSKEFHRLSQEIIDQMARN